MYPMVTFEGFVHVFSKPRVFRWMLVYHELLFKTSEDPSCCWLKSPKRRCLHLFTSTSFCGIFSLAKPEKTQALGEDSDSKDDTQKNTTVCFNLNDSENETWLCWWRWCGWLWLVGTGELIVDIVGLWAAWPSFSTETPKVLLYIYIQYKII